jgi:hypothetical protein
MLINPLTNHKVLGNTTWKVLLISHGAVLALLEKRGAPDSFIMSVKAMDVAGSFHNQSMGGGDMPIRVPGYVSPQEAMRAHRRSVAAAPGSQRRLPAPQPAPIRLVQLAVEEDVGSPDDDDQDEDDVPVYGAVQQAPRVQRRPALALDEDEDDGYGDDDDEEGVFGTSSRSKLWRKKRGLEVIPDDHQRGQDREVFRPRHTAQGHGRSAPVPRPQLAPLPLDPAVMALRRAVAEEAEMAQAPDRFRLAPGGLDAAAARLGATQGLNGSRFGLKKDDVPAGLGQEIALLVETAQDKGVNLLRSGVFTTALADSTVDRLVKDVLKYMGYLQNIRRWGSAQLSLVAFNSMTCFFDYIEFLVDRGVETTELKKQTKLAMSINEFMCNLLTLRGSGAATGEYKGAVEQLSKLQAELGSRDRREKGTKIREEVKLPTASQAMAFVERVMDKALDQSQEWLKTVEQEASAAAGAGGAGPSTQASVLPYQLSSLVRDAAMLGMAVGHVGLTVRIKAIRTVKDPKFSATVCTDTTCTSAACKGNIVDITFPDELVDDIDDSDTPECRLLLPHHKNSNRGIAMPTVPITSSKLCKLLGTWTKHGRPRFEDMAKEIQPGWKDPETLFISAQGKSFQGLTAWYKSVHETHNAPYPYLPINTYRKVFVADRLENPDRPGPSNEGAAIIMGNSVRQWQASYWPNKQQKLAHGAAADMEVYRQGLLADAGYYMEEGEEEESEGEQ